MTNTLLANWWTGLLAMSAIALLAISIAAWLREWGIRPLRDVSEFLQRPRLERLLLVFFVCGMVQYAATKGTGSGNRSSDSAAREDAVDEIEMTTARIGDQLASIRITNLCFTGVAILTHGVELGIAWPTNFFSSGTTLDFFVKHGGLTNAWQWFAYCPTSPGMTNLTVTADWQDDLGCATQPPAMFFKVQDRATCADTMADSDGDGLPDVYEFNNGTNPYVSDYALASKLTVGDDGDYGSLAAALSASTNYSIVELSSDEESLERPVTLPSHPVLITGPRDGYARLYSSANIAVFLLDEGQDNETIFRNLCVVMTAREGFQSAFWIGGNLPWSGVGSSPTFENVRVRALYPNVLHYGWHYYRDNADCSSVSNCAMNVAGSTSASGVYAYDGPDIEISDCVFVNFPTNADSYAVWMKDGTNVVAVTPQADTNLSWAGYALDGSYSSTADSDGDGLSDYDEIFVHDTDPWLPDSDGDGMTDAEEINDGSDPQDLYSFYRRMTVVTTTTDDLDATTNYVAWGTSAVGWETNDMICCWTCPTTNLIGMMSSDDAVYVKSFRDLNRNGRYDSEADILLIRQVPQLTAITSFAFVFGDVDGDGISDDMERMHGTDPYDRVSKCFNMALTIDDVPHTANALTSKATFEGAVIWGPNVVTGTVLSADLGHLTSTNGDSVVLTFWDDANGNSIVDTNEWSTAMSFCPTGHENAIERRFDRLTFDRDNDGMPDHWESLHVVARLSPTNAADAWQDYDGDGLINCHEYWAGCDPAAPDGSNTIFSVCSRSVDDRISNIVPSNAVDRFVNFFENAPSSFVANTNFWLRDVDVSCVSVWNDGDERGSMAATAVTRRHVIMSAHWSANLYYFCLTNGQIITRSIERTYQIPDSDILLGRLNTELPESIYIPRALGTNLVNLIAYCKYLPGVCMNNRKAMTILELDSLNCSAFDGKFNRWYHLLGKTSAHNVVSIERDAVWAATSVGNSSSPVFLLVNNELVFLFSKHLGYKRLDASKENWGPVVSHRLMEVQGKINEWEGENSPNYQIEIMHNFYIDN